MTDEWPKLSGADLAVILDTLIGANRISDAAGIWKYTCEARELAIENLLGVMEAHRFEVLKS